MTHSYNSRRQFLRTGLGAAAMGTAITPLGLNLATLSSAMAQSNPDDYKALVCVFLFGGNDAHNTVLATDTTTWNDYASARGQWALSPDSVLPLSVVPQSTHAGRGFALNPALAPLQELFNGMGGDSAKRRLAVVPNVGTLLAPTTKAQYQQGTRLPAQLFSHNDQFIMWQAGGVEGTAKGWGGLFGDEFTTRNGAGSVFTCVSPAGNAVWLAGQSVVQYQVLPVSGAAVPIQGRDNLFGSTAAGAAYAQVLQRSGGLFENEHTQVVQRSINAQQAVTQALSGIALGQLPPGSGALAGQLRAVAAHIKAASSGTLPGVKRQIFFVSAGGYDTHNNQFVGSDGGPGEHTALLGGLANALRYFHDELGDALINQVTTFTASDFGRTLLVNGDGTDHGWGGHHLVMGGAVKGGDVYGRWPDLSSNSQDLVELGRNLLPRIAVDQYAATLGSWFGVSDAQLLNIFPNLQNFNSAEYPRNLGFMQA
jgi:uncharacterized protein (DUF1501 family)